MKFEAYIQRGDYGRGMSLGITIGVGCVRPMVISKIHDGEEIEPFIEGKNNVTNFVQAVMDAGWKAGLKPAGYEDASRELTATKFHLEDMRLLAKVKK